MCGNLAGEEPGGAAPSLGPSGAGRPEAAAAGGREAARGRGAGRRPEAAAFLPGPGGRDPSARCCSVAVEWSPLLQAFARLTLECPTFPRFFLLFFRFAGRRLQGRA